MARHHRAPSAPPAHFPPQRSWTGLLQALGLVLALDQDDRAASLLRPPRAEPPQRRS